MRLVRTVIALVISAVALVLFVGLFETKVERGRVASDTVVDIEISSPEESDKKTSSSDGATTEEKYVHGEDGYYNLDDDGIPVNLRVQTGGTCWAYAAAVSLETGYAKDTGKEAKVDPLDIVKHVYDENREEGYSVPDVNPMEYGGYATLVAQTLSNGFEGYVLTRGIYLPEHNADTIKEYIKKYGAVCIGIPDAVTGTMGNFHGYSTLNCVTDDLETYDHSISIVGWDDHFPKEYFRKTASQDGAWITANSSFNSGYYYVSYDTKPDYYNDIPMFLSMSDEYSYVATHDWGYDISNPLKLDKEVTVANVYNRKGTLSAIGTYSLEKDQDIIIKIYDDKFSKCLYTQKEHLKDTGYQVIKLKENVYVTDYAVAITYSAGVVPVEGKGGELDEVRFNTASKKGESFIKLGDKWYDLHEKETLDKLGRKDKTNNCCIKVLYN